MESFNQTNKSRPDFNIKDYGAKADAEFINTTAIQAAVDAAEAAGGGRVVVPEGLWISGTIWLKNHVELHLAKGATILGSTKQEDYNANDAFPENFWSNGEEWSGGHLVLGYRVEDVAISGEGVIDGNGPAFFDYEPEEDSRFPWYKYGLKLHPIDRDWFRPGPMIAFFHCKDVKLTDVTFANTPCWTCHVRCSEFIRIQGVKIDCDRTIANSDGFSIDCTRDVVITDCTLLTGDDGFAIRASCPDHAEENPCEKIYISNCDVSSCCGGVRFGVGTGLIRNVVIENCRFHESAVGMTFTPAFGTFPKNVYIEDVVVRDTVIRECERPVSVWHPMADAQVCDVLFERCNFESLLPSTIGANKFARTERITFKECVSKQIYRIKYRQNLNWLNNHSERPSIFATVSDLAVDVKFIDCIPSGEPPKGVLALAFDDRNFDDWVNAIPLFEKYNAHATFFVSGKIDAVAVRAMKKLSESGHTIGLHGETHANADVELPARGAERYFLEEIFPQTDLMQKAYIPYSSFGYPNNRHSQETDEFFFNKGFRRLRCGNGLTPYDPERTRPAPEKPLHESDEAFFPVTEMAERKLIPTIIMGEAYRTDIEDILQCIRRAAERHEVFAVTSHGIHADAKRIHMKTEWLEKMLETAKECGVSVLGFDELK